jgi:hypothetical protein
MRVFSPLPTSPRTTVVPPSGPAAHIETPTPKEEPGFPFRIMSPLGNQLARAASVDAAVGVAEAFGSGAEIWFRSERLGVYERGAKVTGNSRSDVRRRLRQTVADGARRIERREADYIARVRAGGAVPARLRAA